MNLHSIVSGVIGAVNPFQPVTIRQSTGYTVNPDFSRVPIYTNIPMNAQIQALQSDDIRLLDGLGIQGSRRSVYLWGATSGMIRSLQKGNDLLLFPDGSEWKVAVVAEDYGHGVKGTSGWCKVLVVLQSQVSEA